MLSICTDGKAEKADIPAIKSEQEKALNIHVNRFMLVE